jgi:putative addiction module killer protein
MKYRIRRTDTFSEWLTNLQYRQGFLRITARIVAAEDGNFGDHKLLPGTGGLSEMRIDCGPGYRVYYGRMGREIYLLIMGGDKFSQKTDIARAKTMWGRIKEEGYADGED